MAHTPGIGQFAFSGVLALACCFAAAPLPTVAQEPTAGTVDVFLPPDHLLRRQLDDARTAIDEEHYNDAVRLLGGLLIGDRAESDELENSIEDYFIEPATEGSAQRSLKAEARRMLAALPPRGLDSFQLLYGREAELLLEKALRDGDAEQLTEVTRKYFYTKSGYQAAMLLGRYHLAQGRPLAAALALKQLYELPARSDFEPNLSLLLAASWMLADTTQRAEEVLIALRERQGKTPLNVGGSPVAMFREDSEALTWLQKTLGKIDLGTGQSEDQWLVFRGNATRNAPVKGGTPLEQVRWAVPTPNDLKQQSAIMAEQEQYVKQSIPALPGLHPLVVRYGAGKDLGHRDVVLTRTPSRLLAVDFKTGQRVWFYPPWGQEPEAGEGASFSTPPSNSDTPQMLNLKQRTWMDAPYGQLSTDGSRVYFIHDLGLAQRVGPTRIVFAGGIIRRNPDSPESHNHLMALELAREGYQVWSVGGEDGTDEPKLAGAFFLGPPLPLMDSLYALAEVNGDVRLVVLDPKTGALQWQQQLCGVDSGAILDDSVRRLGGASPSFSEGVLICPTSAGAIVAVDVAKRSLLWGYQYLNVPQERRVNGAFFPSSRSSQSSKKPGEAWADSSVTIVGNKVLITPVEHDEIICLDLLQGTRSQAEEANDKPLWKRARGDGLYVACSHDGNAVIVGKQSVVAVDLETGEEVWKALVPDAPANMPSGRGFAAGDSYFLPLTSSEIVEIDLRGGKLIAVSPTRGILGNLICYRDTVISQGTTELTSFYQREALGRVVADALKENPDDAWALTRRAELLLKDGQRAEASAALRRSYEIEADDGTKALLVNTLLAALEEDFVANQKLAVEVEPLIDRADQRAAFLRSMAVGLQEIGELQTSFAFYLKIIDEDAIESFNAPGDAIPMHRVNDQLQVRGERWIRARLADLLSEVTDEERQEMDRAIQQRLKAVLNDGSTSSLRRYIEFFGLHPTSQQASLELATKLWNAGELLEAELILIDLTQTKDNAVAAPATAQLARLLSDAGHAEESAAMYERLRDEFADVDAGSGKTGQQIVDQLAEGTQVAKLLAGTPDWPLGRVTMTHHDNEDNAGPKLGYSSYQKVYPSQLQETRGPVPQGARIVLDQHRRVIFRDGLGRQGASVQLSGSRITQEYRSNYSITSSKLTGHLALVALGYELRAIDMLQTTSNDGHRLLWTQDLASPLASKISPQQVIPKVQPSPWGGHQYFAGDTDGKPIAGFTAASTQGVVFRRDEQLICCDPLRPDVVHWIREGIAVGAEIFGDEQVVIVVAPDATEGQIVSVSDGPELGTCEIGERVGTWATVGRKILRWNQTDAGVTVAMIDPWDEETKSVREAPVLWSHDFSTDARGTRIENDEIAIVELDGQLTLIDLNTGKIRFESKLESEIELAGLYVLRGADQYIILANRPINDAPAGTVVRSAPGGLGPLGQDSPLVSGRVYALDRKTGESLWPVPAVIEHFGLPLDQPTMLPMVAFMRNTASDPGSPTHNWKTELVCLDKRDGRIAFHPGEISGETRVYRIEADPDQHTAAIMFAGESFTLQWTDQPRPPQPPAQLSSATESPTAD